MQVGTYDPLPSKLDGVKEVRLRVDRVKYWLSVGGQPSGRVGYLLWRAGLLPAPPIRYTPSKWPAKEKKGFHTLTDARRVAASAVRSVAPAAALPALGGLGSGSPFGRGLALTGPRAATAHAPARSHALM
jgi:ribosomal protein S16